MKKHFFLALLPILLLTASCFVSCNCVKKTDTTENPPKSNDSIQAAMAAAQIIIEDTKVMLQRGTGLDNCDCTNGTWSSLSTLTTVNTTVSLPSFNLSGNKPRALVLCEVTFADNSKGQFKLTFDKGCNVLKFKGCMASSIPLDKKSVKVAKNTVSVNVKPDYDLANSAKFTLTPSNCNGCKFRYKRCTGNWVWGDCAPMN